MPVQPPLPWGFLPSGCDFSSVSPQSAVPPRVTLSRWEWHIPSGKMCGVDGRQRPGTPPVPHYAAGWPLSLPSCPSLFQVLPPRPCPPSLPEGWEAAAASATRHSNHLEAARSGIYPVLRWQHILTRFHLLLTSSRHPSPRHCYQATSLSPGKTQACTRYRWGVKSVADPWLSREAKQGRICF